ncbi:MAG: Hsp20 family protein [Bryobacteraceae bacterium]
MKPKFIPVHRITDNQIATRLLTEKLNGLMERVRTRAHELFDRRGHENGHDLDDWFQAERECGMLPIARIEDAGTEIRIRIERPEFTADQLKVHAEPQAITVEGAAVQEYESGDPERFSLTERALFGRYELPAAIDTDLVNATLEDGVLRIVARKADLPVEASPIKTDEPRIAKMEKERFAVA